MATKSTKKIDTLALTPSSTAQVIAHVAKMKKKRSLFIWGPPGISKSSIIAQEADKMGYGFVDIRLSQMDPTDLRGIPHPVKTKDSLGNELNGMAWSAPLVLPRDKDAKVFILLDEFNSAPPSVQAAAYQLILDRKLGEYEVPKNCVIIAAGNRETDKGVTFRMATPIANRFIHVEMEANFDDWQNWALRSNVNPSVVGYLTAFKHELFQFDANSASRGFATPRTWEFVSDILDDSSELPELLLQAMVGGAIGDGLAATFMEYRRNAADLPAASDVLSGKVKTLNRKDVSLCYALTTAMCYELKSTFERYGKEGKKAGEQAEWNTMTDNFLGFMMENFQPEVTIMGAKTALSVFQIRIEPRKLKNFAEFSKKYQELIMG